MNNDKKIIIVLVIIILFMILNPIRIKYFTDTGKLSRYLLEIYEGRASECTILKLENSDIEIQYIQRNKGYRIYYAFDAKRSDFISDRIVNGCYGGVDLSNGGDNHGSISTYSNYYLYGIKGNKVYTLEYLLIKKMIDPDSFLNAFQRFKERNEVRIGVRDC